MKPENDSANRWSVVFEGCGIGIGIARHSVRHLPKTRSIQCRSSIPDNNGPGLCQDIDIVLVPFSQFVSLL
jgi:hypothetical protein